MKLKPMIFGLAAILLSLATACTEDNASPTASFEYSPNSDLLAGTTVSFTCTSTDSDGVIASRYWTISDGASVLDSSESSSFSYTFTSAGTYTVSLTVTDDGNASDTASATLEVEAAVEIQGAGTQTDPYLISSAKEWNYIAVSLNSNSSDFANSAESPSYFELTADLDFSTAGFTYIASFYGVLNGNCHSMTGIDVSFTTGVSDITSSSYPRGVVGYNAGTIEKLYVEADFVSDAKCLGIIAGYNDGTLNLCYAKGDIAGPGRVGGVVGYNCANVLNCGFLGGTVLGIDSVNATNVGGVVGTLHNSKAIVANCFSWATEVHTQRYSVGGLVGNADTGSSKPYLINAYETTTLDYIVGELWSSYNTSTYEAKCLTDNESGYAIGRSWTAEYTAVYVLGDEVCGFNQHTQKEFELHSVVTIDQMKQGGGSVVEPWYSQTCASFLDALNAGITNYENWTSTSGFEKPSVALDEWVYVSGRDYPVHKSMSSLF